MYAADSLDVWDLLKNPVHGENSLVTVFLALVSNSRDMSSSFKLRLTRYGSRFLLSSFRWYIEYSVVLSSLSWSLSSHVICTFPLRVSCTCVPLPSFPLEPNSRFLWWSRWVFLGSTMLAGSLVPLLLTTQSNHVTRLVSLKTIFVSSLVSMMFFCFHAKLCSPFRYALTADQSYFWQRFP